MFTKKFKLLATMVGLVAVLVMGLAVPGATQQNPLSRASVVTAVNNAISATLTAAEGDIWDTQCTHFYSTERFSLALIPLHPSSRSLQMLLVDKDARNVTIGAMYVPEDISNSVFRAGTYLVKIEDPSVNPVKILIVDQDGNTVYTTSANVERSNTPKPELYRPCFPKTVKIIFPSNPAGLPLGALAPVPVAIEVDEICILWCAIKIKGIKIVVGG